MCGTAYDRRKDLFMIIKFKKLAFNKIRFSSNKKKSTILLFKCANFFVFVFVFVYNVYKIITIKVEDGREKA